MTNTNQKGFILAVIPLTLAILGILGTGALAGVDHQKSSAQHRDVQRQSDILVMQSKLVEFYAVNKNYPLQKNQASSGQQVLKTSLGDIPADPLSAKDFSYWYWSDGQVYTLRYFVEASRTERIFYSQ